MADGGERRGTSRMERGRASRRRGEARGEGSIFFMGGFFFKVETRESGIGLQSDPSKKIRENWTCGN